MKFSEMLGEPDPARETPEEPEPISVFAPVPTTPPPTTASWGDDAAAPPAPVTPTAVPPVSPSLPGPAVPAPPLEFAPAEPVAPRSGLAEVNVLSPSTAPTEPVETFDEVAGLAGLTEVDDDLLPSARRRK